MHTPIALESAAPASNGRVTISRVRLCQSSACSAFNYRPAVYLVVMASLRNGSTQRMLQHIHRHEKPIECLLDAQINAEFLVEQLSNHPVAWAASSTHFGTVCLLRAQNMTRRRMVWCCSSCTKSACEGRYRSLAFIFRALTHVESPVTAKTLPVASALLDSLSRIHAALRRPGLLDAAVKLAGGCSLGIHMAMLACTALSASGCGPLALSVVQPPGAAAITLTPALLHIARCVSLSNSTTGLKLPCADPSHAHTLHRSCPHPAGLHSSSSFSSSYACKTPTSYFAGRSWSHAASWRTL